jgi:hypothetical protein
MGFEPIEHPLQHVGRDARPAVDDGEQQCLRLALDPHRHGRRRRREAHGIGQQIEQDLPHPPLVGDEAADVGRRLDVERDVGAHQPVLHAFGGGLHGLADIDRPEIELHAAGVDGGEVEDVVDQRQQGVGRDRDVIEIFALFGDERAGRRIAQQMDEADDVGERRAQLVGHVMDEIDLDPVRLFERLVALDQRALDVH